MLEEILKEIVVAVNNLAAVVETRNSLSREMLDSTAKMAQDKLLKKTENEVGESETELDRDALLQQCADLGIDVPKGTKTPTLPKLIAQAQAKQDVEVVDAEVVEPATETEIDIFGDAVETTAEVVEVKEWTDEEFRNEIVTLAGGNLTQAVSNWIKEFISKHYNTQKVTALDNDQKNAFLVAYKEYLEVK